MSSPLCYDPNLAKDLAASTSYCNATSGYGFTSPTAYIVNSTATTAPASTTPTCPPTCTAFYTVQPGDSCDSVAQALTVSTYSLMHENDLDIYCQNFAAAVNSTLCIPQQCTTYVWQPMDTCDSITRSLGADITVADFLSWNPGFNVMCQNGAKFVGNTVCIR